MPAAEVVRGSVVRPTLGTIGRTRYREASRLKVGVRRSMFPLVCRGCEAPILNGELYARGSEPTSNLCLGCVEPA